MKLFYDFLCGIFNFSIRAKNIDKAVKKANKRIKKSKHRTDEVVTKENITKVSHKHRWARKKGGDWF